MNSLDRSDLLNRCHAARAYLEAIKRDFDAAHCLFLGSTAADAAQSMTACIDEINKLDAEADAALAPRTEGGPVCKGCNPIGFMFADCPVHGHLLKKEAA